MAALFLDHLVGAGKDRRRDGEAERLVSPKIDDQLETRRLLERQRSAPYNARLASSLSRTFDHLASGGIGATPGDAGFRRMALIRVVVDATSTR
jgi:hypothetical protein